VKSYCQYLSEQYGGKWKYNYTFGWWCDDKNRRVSRVCMCSHDGYCDCIPTCWLYEDGKIPLQVTPPRNVLEKFWKKHRLYFEGKGSKPRV